MIDNTVLISSPLGVLIKTTLVDYPGKTACTYFLKGCNLRCPYCYNTELVLASTVQDTTDFVSPQTVLQHLQKRKNVLSGFVISGGEALLHPITPFLIRSAHELGYQVKIDTNGLLPQALAQLLENPQTKPDFIAMDIKTSPAKYTDLLKTVDPALKKDPSLSAVRLSQTINILTTQYDPDSYEFRTVLVPPLVTKEDIDAIAALLPHNAAWQFAQFRNDNCLDKSYNDITPYTDVQVNQLVQYAQTYLPKAALR
ncbi:MAG: anaerobic ribonucleoside-triphosphate reductase activating protein [Treponema sp.]|nr:anaerobic ribonucleoside-triphosphate reductase activating protein [Treponema sp.]